MKLYAPQLIKYLSILIVELKLSRLHRLLSRLINWIPIYYDKKPLGFAYDTVEDKGGLKSSACLDEFGQLSIKEEAAGKVRVFALVDIWTQSVLKPIHEHIFKVLKSLPNDGTFDQGASVNRCFEKAKIYKCSFGYDLSAATDRLPIDLQKAVLAVLFGEVVSNA